MSEHIYVGLTPRFLSTGRPITFGTVLQDDDLLLADDATSSQIVSRGVSIPKADKPTPAPAPAPAPAVSSAPAPQEVVNTGNPS